jgi:1-acyl-sn-glycerol-3-phosphate acyltransferase
MDVSSHAGVMREAQGAGASLPGQLDSEIATQRSIPATPASEAHRPLRFFVGADPWLYKVARALVRPTVAPFFRFEVSGEERQPASGPALLAVNHQCDIDPLFVGVAVPRPLHYMTESEKWARPVLPRVIERLGAFPVVRGAADLTGMRTALRLLAAGEAVVIFPEGDPFREARPHEFHPGVGLIAVRSGAPVFPLALTGADRLAHGGWLRRPAVRLTVGAPLDLSRFGPRVTDYAAVAAVVRSAVVGLHQRESSLRSR